MVQKVSRRKRVDVRPVFRLFVDLSQPVGSPSALSVSWRRTEIAWEL